MASALATVGLDGSLARRRIDQLSGGQMRRLSSLDCLPAAAGADPRRTSRRPGRGEPGRVVSAAGRSSSEHRLTVVVISHDFVGLEDLCPGFFT